MNRRTSFVVAIGLSIAMLMTSACGAVTSMIGGGGGAAAKDLWPDVPQMPGMTKQSGDLPLPIRLGMQAMMQAMAKSESGSLDNVEFLTFTTAKTAEELRSFYSTDAMSALGWTMPGLPGCAGAAAGEQAAALPGEVCIYGRDAGNGKSTILLIMTTRDDGKADSLVYFYRLSGVKINQPAQ